MVYILDSVNKKKLLFAVLFIVIASFLQFSVTSEASTSESMVRWAPQEFVETIYPGGTIEKTATFSFESPVRRKLKKINMKLWISPSIRSFVSLNQKKFKKIISGKEYAFNIVLSVPSDTLPGEYEGSLQLRGEKRGWSRHLRKWLPKSWKKKQKQIILSELTIKLTVANPQELLAVKHKNLLPTRLAQEPGGKLYVSDAQIGSVFIYDTNLSVIGELKNLDIPLGVAVDSEGNIYVGNRGRQNVEVYSPNGIKLFVIGNGAIPMPNDLALDLEGNLYVVDSLSDTVKVYDATGHRLQDIGGPGDGDGGLKFPVAVTISYRQPEGELYIADQGHGKVKVFDLQGNFLRAYGGPTDMFLSDIENEDKFSKIQSLAIDGEGRLHAVDSFANHIQLFNADMDTGAYLGSYGAFGTGVGQLNLPLDIFINDSGQVLVTNAGNRRVEIMEPPSN